MPNAFLPNSATFNILYVEVFVLIYLFSLIAIVGFLVALFFNDSVIFVVFQHGLVHSVWPLAISHVLSVPISTIASATDSPPCWAHHLE